MSDDKKTCATCKHRKGTPVFTATNAAKSTCIGCGETFNNWQAEPDTMTVAEACKVLDVPAKSITTLVWRGCITPVDPLADDARLDAGDVRRLVEQMLPGVPYAELRPEGSQWSGPANDHAEVKRLREQLWKLRVREARLSLALRPLVELTHTRESWEKAFNEAAQTMKQLDKEQGL